MQSIATLKNWLGLQKLCNFPQLFGDGVKFLL